MCRRMTRGGPEFLFSAAEWPRAGFNTSEAMKTREKAHEAPKPGEGDRP